ncbi:CopG family transcriptional regulator [Noviherbaspirillum malthae]|jgi:predicted transcriptional regulator|uniref:ribbon-helix-helix domain-containing protein n=1 Tax=Noviherbaspirillum malthae TaxID=1260987 RepID=UPI00188F6470|nr:CopG family transcriptional regulator [Noviherbaspirillum malthae]
MKKTMTLVLSDSEMDALESLSEKRSISKAGLIRQALKLYQTVETRQDNGDKIFIENAARSEKSELLIL